jgi:riboflavin biosynthesis pyrimidine reductase
MSRLAPFEVLLDHARGARLPLPRSIASVYGPLRFPRPSNRRYVIGNFATTLDGVVSLSGRGASGGGEITGFDPHDRALMGILRAVADVVILGAGTFRAVPRHQWTAEHVYPGWATEYAALRRRLGKPPTPLNVVVSASGRLDLELPLFSRGEVPVEIVTTPRGAARLRDAAARQNVGLAIASRSRRIPARSVLHALPKATHDQIVLVEGGPHLIGTFFAEHRLDELFLTLAPQVAGRADTPVRPGLVAGQMFAPRHPLWGSLVGVRRHAGFLYLRFAFEGERRVSRRLRSGAT